MKLLAKAAAIFDRSIDSLTFLACVVLALVVLVVSVDVICRYFLHRPLFWVMEITEYSLLYLTFLATAWVLKTGRHVKIDVVLNLINPRRRALTNTITSIVAAIMCLLVAWYGAESTWDHFQKAIPYTGGYIRFIPRFSIMAVIPAGSFLLFIQFLRETYRHFADWRARQLPSPPVP